MEEMMITGEGGGGGGWRKAYHHNQKYKIYTPHLIVQQENKTNLCNIDLVSKVSSD